MGTGKNPPVGCRVSPVISGSAGNKTEVMVTYSIVKLPGAIRQTL